MAIFSFNINTKTRKWVIENSNIMAVLYYREVKQKGTNNNNIKRN